MESIHCIDCGGYVTKGKTVCKRHVVRQRLGREHVAVLRRHRCALGEMRRENVRRIARPRAAFAVAEKSLELIGVNDAEVLLFDLA